ncbi:MAG: hypothetical protein JNN15_11970 [Blastocatellia bacterium]|nr:hypothetical protein [Blastocatellia bacterium]
MKRLPSLLFISFALLLPSSTIVFAQYRINLSKIYYLNPQARSKNKAKKPSKSEPTATPNSIKVRVKYTNGKEIVGRLIDINPRSLSVDPGNGTVIISSIQEVSTITIGENRSEAFKPTAEFLKDANNAYLSLLSLSQATDNNISFNEYQPKVAQVKNTVEAFINKHSTAEAKEIFESMRSAVRAFELVIPVWMLRTGVEQHKYVLQTSSQMKPIIEMYPDILNVNWKQNDRYPVEKVIAWVWVEASKMVEKTKVQIKVVE